MLFCTAFASLQLQASPERGGGPAKLVEGFAATAANRFHKELRFFFSLLKRKKEAKKEKNSRFTCSTRFKYHPKITYQQKSPGGANRRLLPP
ncbi:hypothetical protein [uncultured Ruminococcus sp.]|uniref:hypothetical protein n=1 Tax=uncultured Ruminococcus sp. TaxID=165186 RepID=UPI00266F2876|nr:hypothetical protein [uncultured Ruminococcus sp.]